VKVFLAPIGTLLPETSDDVPDVGGLGAKHVGAERKANLRLFFHAQWFSILSQCCDAKLFKVFSQDKTQCTPQCL